MTRVVCTLLVCLLAGPAAFAGLTPEQKVADLKQLAALYAKNYAPYEWKRDALGFDLYDLQPWLERAERTLTDLEYLDLLIEYVASLNDAHDVLTFPFNFQAQLPITLDIYDGKVLIDSINRMDLPVLAFPFQIGDELVSLDGVSASDWIVRMRNYSISANPRSTDRIAASRIALRPQSRIPWAHEIGDEAVVVIRRASTGAEETYSLRWTKTGFPITEIGPVPDLLREAHRPRVTPEAPEAELTPWAKPLAPLMNASIQLDEVQTVLGLGSPIPNFALPAGFQRRLSGSPFYSGTFRTEGKNIGFIRIPTMNPALGASTSLLLFEQEIQYFQASTDALVIDVMRNPGGLVSFVDELCRRLHPTTFRTMGFEVRATLSWLNSFAQSVVAAKQTGQPDWLIAALQARYDDILHNYLGNRGRSGPVPLTYHTLDLTPATDASGNVLAYTKPILVLVDEFSASGGDAFPAILQDNNRATIFGMRTMGAGGSVVNYPGANFTEGNTRVTVSLMNRNRDISTAEYPSAPYVENIGVRPDIVYDYMTRENLLTGAQPFVQAFTQAVLGLIR